MDFHTTQFRIIHKSADMCVMCNESFGYFYCGEVSCAQLVKKQFHVYQAYCNLRSLSAA
jgi:hypothetical protein